MESVRAAQAKSRKFWLDAVKMVAASPSFTITELHRMDILDFIYYMNHSSVND